MEGVTCVTIDVLMLHLEGERDSGGDAKSHRLKVRNAEYAVARCGNDSPSGNAQKKTPKPQQ